MEIESIGNATSQQSQASSTSVLDQAQFIQLFVDQLRFQDPLEPVNNREFLAQLATFSNVQQNSENGRQLESIAQVSSVDQSVALLGKTVEVNTTVGIIVGEVKQVNFTNNGPRVTIDPSSGPDVNDIRLSQIRLIRE